jgi:hypothetical protein
MVGVGTHLAMHVIAVVVVDGREGCGLCGCGCLFPTCAVGIIYFQKYTNYLCPVSSVGLCVV